MTYLGDRQNSPGRKSLNRIKPLTLSEWESIEDDIALSTLHCLCGETMVKLGAKAQLVLNFTEFMCPHCDTSRSKRLEIVSE